MKKYFTRFHSLKDPQKGSFFLVTIKPKTMGKIKVKIVDTVRYMSHETYTLYKNAKESTTNVEGVKVYTLTAPTTVEKVKNKVAYFTGCWLKTRPFAVIVPNVKGMEGAYVYQTQTFKKLYELDESVFDK